MIEVYYYIVSDHVWYFLEIGKITVIFDKYLIEDTKEDLLESSFKKIKHLVVFGIFENDRVSGVLKKDGQFSIRKNELIEKTEEHLRLKQILNESTN